MEYCLEVIKENDPSGFLQVFNEPLSASSCSLGSGTSQFKETKCSRMQTCFPEHPLSASSGSFNQLRTSRPCWSTAVTGFPELNPTNDNTVTAQKQDPRARLQSSGQSKGFILT